MVVPGALPVPDQPPAVVRDVADEVLARPEFRQPPPGLLERVQDGLADLIDRVLGALGSGGVGAVVAWAVVAALVAVVVLLVVRVARTTRVGASGAGVAVSTRRRATTPEEWTARARRHDAAGEHREGLRCRYRALVAELARRGVADDIAGRTTGEERRAVARALPAAADDMTAATELFERIWYGGDPAGPAEAARFEDLSDAVRAVAPTAGTSRSGAVGAAP